jgi:hypothetical protein
MFRSVIGIVLILLLVSPAGAVFAAPVMQEPTPEVTPDTTPDPSYVYEVIDGQDVRYDYVISAGDVMVSGLLVVLVFSVWGLGGILIFGGRKND